MGKLSMEERLHGLLLGQAVGDAIGLPFEGIKASRVAVLLGDKPLSHRFFLGSGMVSDDTEHATMTANAILASDNDLPHFLRSLSWRLRFWGIALPAVLFCWLRNTDYREAATALVRAGGDTDSTAAILGALMGATYGVESIPQDWIRGLRDWPRNKTLLSRLAKSLTHSGSPVNGFWPAILPRNILFFLIVLVHGFRRLLPPYG